MDRGKDDLLEIIIQYVCKQGSRVEKLVPGFLRCVTTEQHVLLDILN